MSAAPILSEQRQGVGGGFAAAGQPIDQVDCTNAGQIVERLRRGLPAQEDALRRTRQQLETAQNDSRRLDAAARQQLQESARRELANLTRDYLKSLDSVKEVAERIKRQTGGADATAMDRLIDKVTDLKTDAERLQTQQNTVASVQEVLQRAKTVRERIFDLNKLFVDAEGADKAFDELVTELWKRNPPMALVARAARVVMEFELASQDSFDRAVEAQQAAHHVNLLQDQLNRVTDRIDLLTARCLTPAGNNTNNTNGNSSGTPPKSGIGAGTIATIAGAAVGGLYGWKYYKDTMAESEALMQEFGNLTNPPSTTTTPTTGGGFNGRFQATVQRSCQTGAANSNPLSPGFMEPCNTQPAGGSCSSTAFDVTVTNGRVTDCGSWLNTGTVQSNGSFTGFYAGACGTVQGVPVSGSFSAGTLSSNGAVCRGNTYNITITLRRVQ